MSKKESADSQEDLIETEEISVSIDVPVDSQSFSVQENEVDVASIETAAGEEIAAEDENNVLEEILPLADFVGEKPNTNLERDESLELLHSFKPGPIVSDGLDISQVSLLNTIEVSAFSQMFNITAIENYSSYIFSSYIKQFSEEDNDINIFSDRFAISRRENISSQQELFNSESSSTNIVPTLTINNPAAIAEGASITITDTILDGADADDADANITYTASAITNGQIELTTNVGVAITSFTHAQVAAGEVVFIHDGSDTTTSGFNVSLADGGENGAGAATGTVTIGITPVDDAPVAVNNIGTTLDEAATQTITSAMLSHSDSDTAAGSVTYTVTSALMNGQLELTTNTGVAISTFTQDDLDNNRVVYVHDGSETISDVFSFEVSDGTTTLTADTFVITVNPINDAPTLTITNPSDILKGASITITDTILDGADADDTDGNITYTASAITNGQIELTTNVGVAITSFTHAQVAAGEVAFIHDGSDTTTSGFNISLADGGENGAGAATGTVTIGITPVDDAPVAVNNTGATLDEAATQTITSAMLSHSDSDTAAGNVTYTVTAPLMNGQLELITNTGVAISTFTQDDLDNNRVVYVHDGSETISDVLNFEVSDGTTTLAADTFVITVNPINDAPTLTVNNPAAIAGGASITITDTILDGADADDADSDITYTASAITNGQIELTTNVGVAITSFTHAQVAAGEVVFVHDNSNTTTSGFIVSLADGGENGAGAATGTVAISIATFGTSGDDVIEGDNGNNIISGLGGNDIIRGNSVTALTPVNLTQTTLNPSPSSAPNFGSSVGISGSVMIVSDTQYSDSEYQEGRVYLVDTNTNAILFTLDNPTPGGGDDFGNSVAIDGNYAIVGAQFDDTTGTDSGSAYIYDLTTGSLLFTLDNPTPGISDFFGWSVAIDSNYVIVGAERDDTTGGNSGAAYIFDVTTGNLLFTLDNPTPGTSDLFGNGVAIDGNYAIVGSWLDNTTGIDSGSAYIFDVTTGNLLFTLDNPTPGGGDNFGNSVAIDGNYAIVGTQFDDTTGTDSGSAYIYDVTTGNLLFTLGNPTPASNDRFGVSVAIDSNYAIVGALFDDTTDSNSGSAYIFDVTTGNLLFTLDNPTPRVSDRFGVSVAIDGNIVTVGTTRDDTAGDDQGAVYQFDVMTGLLIETTLNPSPSSAPNFGSSVGISGSVMIVSDTQYSDSEYQEGRVYLVDTNTNAILFTLDNPTPGGVDNFGNSVAIDGNYAIVGALFDDTTGTDSGSAYIYDVTTGNLLFTLDNPTPRNGDYFGSSVAIDGNYAIVGALFDDTTGGNSGSAYIFDVTTGNLLFTLDNPTPGANDLFGNGVAIDGNYAIVGAQFDNTTGIDSGSVYIFDVTTGNLLFTLDNPTPETGDYFGSSVAIDGTYAIVGAERDDTGAGDSGSVYIFDVTTGNLLFTLDNPTPGGVDNFGKSVAIDGNIVTVGATGDDTAFGNAGAVYTFQIDFDDADTLFGGDGDDILYGLEGADTLYGGDGFDTLYGGENSDRFVLEAASVFNDIDRIEDFNRIEGDVIDISDVLVGYVDGVSDIDDFARLVDSGGDTTLEIDADGTVNGVNFQAAAFIVGGSSLTISDLDSRGQLDAVV